MTSPTVNGKVSVIIPTYNRSYYLHQAIASVLAQTYHNFEIIVVDDGSEDDTQVVVAQFNDPRIIYLYQENAGRSVARNKGLSKAQGNYIAFLDDDDRFLPDKLAVQVGYLDSQPEIMLVSGGARLVTEDGSIVAIQESGHKQPEITLPQCLYACPLFTCSVLFRRQCLELLDHWFDPQMDLAEDTDFWIRLLLAGCQMNWIEKTVAEYRWHDHNSQQDKTRYYQSFLFLYDKFFSRPNLPKALQKEKPRLYTIRHTVSACEAYQIHDFAEAKARLTLIETWTQDTNENVYGIVAETIANFAYAHVAPDSEKFVYLVFDHLPRNLKNLTNYRREALAFLHMKRVFMAQPSDQLPLLREWLLGVYHQPTWLSNRGVWSILLRQIFFRSQIGIV